MYVRASYHPHVFVLSFLVPEPSQHECCDQTGASSCKSVRGASITGAERASSQLGRTQGGGTVHANGYTAEHLKKMHGAIAGPSEAFHTRAP
jgi:hypothetical protein